MRETGLRGLLRDKSPRTTKPAAETGRPGDLVERDFTATRPNQLWVADLTYVRTAAGWAYAAFVLDVFSRLFVGWQVATSLYTDLALDALQMAIWRRQAARRVRSVTRDDPPGHRIPGNQLIQSPRNPGLDSRAEQRQEVAALATRLFGTEIPTSNVIGESLRRATVGMVNPTRLAARLTEPWPENHTALATTTSPSGSSRPLACERTTKEHSRGSRRGACAPPPTNC